MKSENEIWGESGGGGTKYSFTSLFLGGGLELGGAGGWRMMRKRLQSLDKAATGGTLYFCAIALTKSSNVAKAGTEASSASTLACEMKMELS